ncbi:hypothetical protein [Thomasclavelia cocleata]|nr:hypothetical protein [Thomasclavelia cocleata]
MKKLKNCYLMVLKKNLTDLYIKNEQLLKKLDVVKRTIVTVTVTEDYI